MPQQNILGRQESGPRFMKDNIRVNFDDGTSANLMQTQQVQ
jgi:hypothetical protein